MARMTYEDFLAVARPVELEPGVAVDMAEGESIMAAELGPRTRRWRAFWVLAPSGRRGGKFQPLRSAWSGSILDEPTLEILQIGVSTLARVGDIMDHSLGHRRASPSFSVTGIETPAGPLITDISVASTGGRGRPA